MSEARLLAEGLYFGEGPRWHDDRLYFSDFYDHAVKTVDLDGKVETVARGRRPAVRARLAARRPDARGVDARPQAPAASSTTARLVVHADLSSIATFHCNDMVVDADGRAYVGNFGFDLDAYMREHGVEGLLADPGPPRPALARVDPDGTVSRRRRRTSSSRTAR